MKNLIVLLILLTTGSLFAQDPILQRDAPDLEKQAFDITEKYNRELALDGKQVTLFEKQVEEFLIEAEEVKNNYTGKEMLDQLFILQNQETAAMRNILTNPQYELYLKIKPRIQPLATVEED